MNVTCTGCPAKYAVPDEKVRGKKVRITCKHCGTNIVVDGSALEAEPRTSAKPAVSAAGPTAAAPDLARAPVPEPAPSRAQQSAAPKAETSAVEAIFIVGFLDDRQEPHPLSAIVDMYESGRIDNDALLWRDGMPDWLPPLEVPELAAALERRGIRATAKAAFSSLTDEEPTVIGRSPFDDFRARPSVSAPAAPAVPEAAIPAAAGIAAEAAIPTAAAIPAEQAIPTATGIAAEAAIPAAAAIPTAAGGQPAPLAAPLAAAALRTERRPAGIDLFGAAAAAGGEDDDGEIEFGERIENEPSPKLTGARNESSVLFSLDALTKPEPKANQKREARAKQQAEESVFGEAAPNSLINLGGGGFSALAAPDFTQPVSASFEPLPSGERVEAALGSAAPHKKGGGVLLVGSLLTIAVIAFGAYFMMQRQAATEKARAAQATEAKGLGQAPVDAPTAPAPSTPVAVPSASVGAPESAPSSGSLPVAAGTESKSPAGPAAPAPAVKPTGAAGAAKPAEPAGAAAPVDTAPAPAPAPEAAASAFDKSAAIAALGAAAASAGSCKKPDGPTGSGKVSVTFAPSGRATATSVVGDLAGTEVGGCVARLFRAAKVPPFSGDPVTVSKSFSIE